MVYVRGFFVRPLVSDERLPATKADYSAGGVTKWQVNRMSCRGNKNVYILTKGNDRH